VRALIELRQSALVGVPADKEAMSDPVVLVSEIVEVALGYIAGEIALGRSRGLADAHIEARYVSKVMQRAKRRKVARPVRRACAEAHRRLFATVLEHWAVYEREVRAALKDLALETRD